MGRKKKAPKKERKKNEAAVALAKLRLVKISPERRKEIARLGGLSSWKKQREEKKREEEEEK